MKTQNQAVIFDMDGVIVDSELHWKGQETAFYSSLFQEWSMSDQASIAGLSMDHLYALLLNEYHLKLTREEFLARYDEMADDIYEHKVALLPGARKLLTQLKEQRFPIALASSSPKRWIKMVLQRFHLQEFFRVVVSADDVQGEGKPEPTIYLFTARQLGVAPTQCFVIEDSRNGVLAAKRAQMFCIGLRNGFNDEQDLSQADLLIQSFAQLDLNLLQHVGERDENVKGNILHD